MIEVRSPRMVGTSHGAMLNALTTMRELFSLPCLPSMHTNAVRHDRRCVGVAVTIWWVRRPDGTLTDLVNLTRAREQHRGSSLDILNVQETARRASPVSSSVSAALQQLSSVERVSEAAARQPLGN